MDYCLACTSSGTWKSYLNADNNTCVATCPDGYFGNSSTMTCDSCDLLCKTCKNLTHCYECVDTYGWNDYNCYDICPIGTFTDLSAPTSNGTFNCTSCHRYCI